VSSENSAVSDPFLGRYLSPHGGLEQLQVLGDGYVFSDRQLTWVGKQADGGV
jgi:hypothetical protein